MSKRNELKDLINRANTIHNNKYGYSLIKNYKSMTEYQDIICPNHGIFRMPLHWHINKGRGCRQCAIDNVTDTKQEFLDKANNVHNFRYNYDKVDYVRNRKKVIITCPEHGDFEQRPRDHINAKQGCPSCKESKGEILVAKILQSFNVDFDRQKTFPDLKHQRLLYYDFYLPEYNSCVEYDGEQHFKSVPGWGGEENLYNVQFRDLLKNEYCTVNNISLLRLSYMDSDTEVRSKVLQFLNIHESFITKFSDFK